MAAPSLLVLVMLVSTVYLAAGVCTFPPDLMGTWISSNSGNITFNSSHLVGYSVYNQGRLDFACLELIGTYYILLSSQFSLFSSPAIAMMCVGFTNIKPSLFKYVIYTSILTDANNQRIRFADNSTTVSTGMACTDLGSTDYYLLMKDGQLDVVKEQCPDVFLGQFSFTFNSTDCANNTGLMDGCTDLQTLSFNYSSCSTVQAYSNGGSVNCVYSTTEGDITYLTVYNPDNTTDEVTYFSFTCYVIEKTSSSSYVYATQHPQDCHSNQTSTYVPAPGANLTMLSSVTCVPSAATPATASLAEASLIAGLVVGFILLLLLVLLVICFYCYKKKTKIQPGKAPIDTGRTLCEEKSTSTEDYTSPSASNIAGKAAEFDRVVTVNEHDPVKNPRRQLHDAVDIQVVDPQRNRLPPIEGRNVQVLGDTKDSESMSKSLSLPAKLPPLL